MVKLDAHPGALWQHPEFHRGAREMVGIALGISAWGLVAGVAMVKSGLGIALSVVMSLPRPTPEQWPYFWGGMAVNWGSWQISSLLGIALAHQLPVEWGVGFAGTMALLAMTYTMVSDRATWLAAAVAACAAVAAYALPLRLNIVVAIAAAVAIGVVIDHARPRLKATPKEVA